jgi:hypothetical protein
MSAASVRRCLALERERGEARTRIIKRVNVCFIEQQTLEPISFCQNLTLGG